MPVYLQAPANDYVKQVTDLQVGFSETGRSPGKSRIAEYLARYHLGLPLELDIRINGISYMMSLTDGFLREIPDSRHSPDISTPDFLMDIKSGRSYRDTELQSYPDAFIAFIEVLTGWEDDVWRGQLTCLERASDLLNAATWQPDRYGGHHQFSYLPSHVLIP